MTMRSLRLCPPPPCPMSTRGRGPDDRAGCHTTPGTTCPWRSTVKPRSQTPPTSTASSVQQRRAMCLSPVYLVSLYSTQLLWGYAHELSYALLPCRPATHCTGAEWLVQRRIALTPAIPYACTSLRAFRGQER